MAEEQTVSTESPQFGQNFFENYQLVDDTGNPVNDTTADPANNPVQDQGPAPQQDIQPPAQPGQPTQQQAQPQAPQAQPTQPPATPSPLDVFFKDDGKGNRSFDAATAMDFLKPVAQAQPPAPMQPQIVQQPQTQPQPPAAPTQPPPTLEQTVKEKMLMAHQIIGDLVGRGYSYEQAVAASQQQIEQYLDRTFLERKFEEQFNGLRKELTEKEKAIQQQREITELTPRATNNLLAVSQRYAQNMPPDKFRDIMFNPKYGGEFINRMFDMQNPDKKGLQGDALKTAMNDWFVRYSADAGNLETLAMVTHAAIQREMMPSIIEHIRTLERGSQQQRQQAAMRKPNGQFATARQQQGGTGFPELDKYLNGLKQ